MTGVGAKPVKALLTATLAGLREREQMLVQAEQELVEVRAAIRAIAPLIGPREFVAPVASSNTAVRVPIGPVTIKPPSPAASTVAAATGRGAMVLAAIKKHQPVAIGVLCRETGLSLTQTKDTLSDLQERNLVQKVGRTASTRYWLTDDLDRYAAEHGGSVPGEEPA